MNTQTQFCASHSPVAFSSTQNKRRCSLFWKIHLPNFGFGKVRIYILFEKQTSAGKLNDAELSVFWKWPKWFFYIECVLHTFKMPTKQHSFNGKAMFDCRCDVRIYTHYSMRSWRHTKWRMARHKIYSQVWSCTISVSTFYRIRTHLGTTYLDAASVA